MKVYQTYIIHRDPPSNLELMVQLISVCNHKVLNPDVPIVFVTDKNSYEFFDKVGFLGLYDEVITDIFDDYPYDRISDKFWSSPKLWLMSKVDTPFIIMDTDLILNKRISEFTTSDLIYLHRELQSGYLRPYEVPTPYGWVWDDLFMYFKQTLPINVSLLCFNNQNFKELYTKTYFDFVLDNFGEVQFPHPDYIDPTGLQTFAEQYLLSALVLKFKLEFDPNFSSKSLSNSIHGFGRFYDEGNFDSFSHDSLNLYVYHLWGGKKYFNNPENHFYIDAYNTVVNSGGEHLRKIGYWDIVGTIFENLKKGLVEPK